MKTAINKSIGHDFLTKYCVKFQEKVRDLGKERETLGNSMFFKVNIKTGLCSLLTRSNIVNR